MKDEELIAETVVLFRILFQKKFSAKIVESSTIIFHIAFGDFRQKFNESINVYHKKLLNLIFKMTVKNRSITEKLSLLKKSTLKKITNAFVKDLHDENVRRKTIRDFIIFN